MICAQTIMLTQLHPIFLFQSGKTKREKTKQIREKKWGWVRHIVIWCVYILKVSNIPKHLTILNILNKNWWQLIILKVVMFKFVLLSVDTY